MSILVQEIVNRSNSALDAEGSERYLFDQDFKPAIRFAQEWVVSVLNKAFDVNKISGESLRELVKIGIWQTNSYSRIAFNETVVGSKLWSILALYPNPVITPFRTPLSLTNKAESRFMADLSYVSGKSCTNRLTLEQWNDNEKNVFMPGNNVLSGDLVEFSYLNFVDYSSTSYNNPGLFEIEIRPSVANKFVGMAYLKKPSEVNLITDSIQFPESLTDIITEQTLKFISIKQGDQTTLYMVTERDIARITSLIQ